MDSSHIPLVIAIVILIVGSAYFSATETAFSSLNRIRMKNMAADGNKRAQLALDMADQYDRLLSTILIGNNIVNICSTSIATVLFIAWFGSSTGPTLSTVVMTVLVLIFGEISPKSLAKESPEKFAMFSAPILRIFLTILAPLNFLFGQWKKLLSHIFPSEAETGITEDELLTIVDEATNDGTFDEQESDLIRSAIEFNDLDVIDVFTPRVSVCGIEDTATTEEIIEVFRDTGFSRLPVYQDNIDHIVGILHEKDFYNHVIAEHKPLSSVLQPPLYIAPSLQISDLLRLFQQSQTHLAIITDEYGGTAGIVTMEDILEELVGEIWDEHDTVEPEIEQISETSYRVRGETRLSKLFDELDLDTPETDLTTVNGWLMSQLSSIYDKEAFVFNGLRFTIEQTNGRYISFILVERICPEPIDSAKDSAS